MSEDRVWNDWPACSKCGRPRQTVCPSCGGAGNRFLLADYQAAASPQLGTRDPTARDQSPTQERRHVLLMCSHCDDAFEPRFYRICPACGRAAQDGIELEDTVSDRVNGRVLLAVFGLVAVACSLLLYFWFLFRDI